MFSPLTYILILTLTGIFAKRKLRKWAFILAAVLFLVFSSPVVFQMYARWFQPAPAVMTPGDHYSFGIVAGGFGSVDRYGDGYFNTAADRFLQTVRLYKIGLIDRILISGGNSKKKDKNFQEAAWAREQMMQFGVPGQVIFVEDRSEGTADNAINSKAILDSLHAQGPYLLITSAFHMPRAKKLYENVGLQVVAYPCNYTEGRGPITWNDLIPSVEVLTSWSKYIKQTVGRMIGK